MGSVRGQEAVELQGAAGPSILIVDDIEANLLALETVLSPLSYRVTRASSGKEALGHILANDFALILLDVMMPGLDGYETAELIRQRERSRGTPIIFLTASDGSVANLMKGYATGGADYLVKPYQPEILRAKVQVFVELHETREEIRRQAELLLMRDRERQRMRTEVRDAVEARGQAEDREAAYRFLAESIPQQVWAATPDGNLDYVSPVIEKYFGQPGATILGAGWLSVLHPEDASNAVTAWTRSLATGEPYEIEFRLRRHDGSYRWHLGRAIAERSPGGAIRRWFGTNTDIDDRRAMESELRAGQQALVASEQRLRLALDAQVAARLELEETNVRAEISERRFQVLAESMPQVMWSMKPDITDVYLNARWYEYTGQDPALPFADKWLLAVHPDDHAACFATWADAQKNHTSWEMEYRLRRHDGVYRWHIGRSVPEVGPSGHVVQWYGTATDIHEQRMAIRSRDDLLATVSHDLRNSLGTISLAADLLHEQLADAAHRRTAGSIQRAARSMEQLLRDLLDISTIEGGHLSIELQPCDVHDLLSEASGVVAHVAAQKSIEVTIAHTAAGTTLRCDRHRILQVFANLLGNAIKFTPSGGSVGISARADGDHVRFAVSDTGPGIEPDQVDFVFDRFWKSKDTAKAGTGLGLAICQGIVQQHGGRLWVESTMGTGTTFFFTIPKA